jgi:hypothetical protein
MSATMSAPSFALFKSRPKVPSFKAMVGIAKPSKIATATILNPHHKKASSDPRLTPSTTMKIVAKMRI